MARHPPLRHRVRQLSQMPVALWRRMVNGVAFVVAWFGLWLPGAVVATSVAGLLALWVWSGSDQSLSQALSLARPWVPALDQLTLDDPQASLREGGTFSRLSWTDGQGLSVTATDVTLSWDALPLIKAQPLALTLAANTVTVEDTRPATDTPPTPPDSLVLPIGIQAQVDIARLSLAGARPVHIDNIRAQYLYEGDAEEARHLLQSLQLDLAQGHYDVQAVVQAQAPMTLSADVQARLSGQLPAVGSASTPTPWQGKLTASVRGALVNAPTMAKLNIQALLQDESAGVRSVHPGLQATATLTPWQRQPLHALQAQLKDLNLAAFWPELPTTQISGQVKAQPPDADSAPATEQTWGLQLALTNAVSGPWDLGKLPLSAIQLQAKASNQLVDVTRLQAHVGAGSIQGAGRWQPGQTTSRAQWTVSALPLHDLHSALAPALMSGTVQWQPTPDAATALALNLNSQPLPGHAKAPATPRLTIQTLKTQGVWNGTRLQLSELWLRAAGAEVRGQGQLTPSPLNVTAQLRVRAPGLDGDLQGTMAADQGSGQLNLQATDLTQLTPWLQAMPMLGDSVPTQWKLTGDARLTTRWHGGWARPGGPELQAQFSNTRTTLATDSSQPALQAQATRLTLDGDLHSARISATTELTRGDLRAKLNLQAHTDMPEPGKGQLTLDQWGLHLQQAQAPQALTLRSPQAVTLNWDSDQWQVGPGELLVQAQARAPASTPAPTQAPVRLNWQQVAMRQGVLISDGQVQQLALNWLDTAGDLLGNSGDRWLSDAGLAGDLVLNGRWQVSWPLKAPAQGQASEPKLLLALQRQNGDLQIRNPGASDTPSGWVATGLQRAQVLVQTQGLALQAKLNWESRLAGQLEAQFQTQLQPLNGTWTLTPKAPLQGSLNARLPELSLWSPLVAPPGWRAQGHATLAAQTTGTLGQPNWSGELVASDLGLKSAVEGLEFGHGRLVARLSGEHIDITELMLEGPGGAKQGGTFSGTGRAQWTTGTHALPQQPRITLQAKASKLRLSARADRRLTLSGDLSAALENQLLTLKGDLAVDQALFILPDETAPTLGDDVILRQTQVATVEKGSRVKTDVLVNIALGDKLEVRGQGLKTRLGGKVSLVSNPANPALRVLGEVRTLDGSYRAYGQQLSISEGVIRFSGPYDDPSLSILAVRPASAFRDSDTQVVGVKITGSARAPLVRLYANPDMPDSEKLAWLVLGRKASGSGAEAAILQQAALALLSGNGGAMDASLSSRLGLDEISFRGSSTQADGTTQAAGVALGKRLSSRLYMAFETSLNTAVGTVSLFYDVSKRLTLRARAGEENAIDLIFTVQHD